MIDGNSAAILPRGDIIDMQNTSSKELYSKIINSRTIKSGILLFRTFLGSSSKEVESMFIVPRVCARDNRVLVQNIAYRY